MKPRFSRIAKVQGLCFSSETGINWRAFFFFFFFFFQNSNCTKNNWCAFLRWCPLPTAQDADTIPLFACERPGGLLAGDSEPLSQGRRSPRLCRDDDKAPKSLCRFDLCPRPSAIFWRALCASGAACDAAGRRWEDQRCVWPEWLLELPAVWLGTGTAQLPAGHRPPPLPPPAPSSR